MKHSFERYCKDYENIENYEAAKKDNFKGWECHHRLETHNSDGERRLVDITKKELKALKMYYNRPAEELIFLTVKEHSVFRKGKHHSEESRNKMSEAMKGNKNTLGYHHSVEAKNKIAEAIRINSTGRHWFNNGKENKFCYKCPDGFVPGKLLIYKETEK